MATIADYLTELNSQKNQLAENLNSMGIEASTDEKLNTLVPKVLECEGKQNVEFVEGTNFAGTIESDGTVSTVGITQAITKISFPDGTTSIGDAAFFSCANLESVTIPDTVKTIGKRAFRYCTSLVNVNIPSGVTNIGDRSFSYCTSLPSITIPESVTDIGPLAFYGCTSAASITLSDGLTTIGERAFNNCTSATSLTIPDSVTSIEFGAFAGMTFTSFTWPDNVVSISDNVFNFCEKLESIIIPVSVTSIGSLALGNTYKLADIYYTGTQAQWNAVTKGSTWNQNMGRDVSGGTTIHYNYVPE